MNSQEAFFVQEHCIVTSIWMNTLAYRNRDLSFTVYWKQPLGCDIPTTCPVIVWESWHSLGSVLKSSLDD